MNCPSCGGKLGVVDMKQDTQSVYRRRKCPECGQLIYTLESEVVRDAEFSANWATLTNESRYKNKRKKEKK